MNGNTNNNASDHQPQFETVDKFDRARGGLKDVALFTKPSTIQTMQTLSGKAETFIVETCRYEDGDHIFIQSIDQTGVVRLHLPPKVCNTMASQREALTKRVRSSSARKKMAERIKNGYVPNFKRKAK